MMVWEKSGRLQYVVPSNGMQLRTPDKKWMSPVPVSLDDLSLLQGTWVRAPEEVGQIVLIFGRISQYDSIHLKHTLMMLPKFCLPVPLFFTP